MNSTSRAAAVAANTGSERRGLVALSDKRGRTRQRIFASTFKLIGHERGLSVRIEEICADAGVSRGTFYNYFSSMEILFQDLAIELSHDFNVTVIATLAAEESAARGANAAIQHYLKRTRRDPAWGWAMVHLSAARPLFGAETYQACEATVKRGIAAGEFDVPSAAAGRDLVLGTCLAAMISTLQGAVSRNYPRTISLHLLRALGVPDARAREIANAALPGIVSHT